MCGSFSWIEWPCRCFLGFGLLAYDNLSMCIGCDALNGLVDVSRVSEWWRMISCRGAFWVSFACIEWPG